MGNRNFRELLEEQWSCNNYVCVGLDSDFSRIPESAHRSGNECDVSIVNTIVAFNRAIVEATSDAVCAYKLNPAFYLAYGNEGTSALYRTIFDIQNLAPKVPVILDGKYGDIKNTNIAYAQAAFEVLNADAITVNPYVGQEPLQPFLDYADKEIIVLCHTSNQGARLFQDKEVVLSREEQRDFFPALDHEAPNCLPFYQYVAHHVRQHWNQNGNCALAVGATYPGDIWKIRRIAPDMPLLILGNGTQGGDIEKTVSLGKNNQGHGMIINFGRSVIFASKNSDFAGIARQKVIEIGDAINQYRLNHH